MNAIIKTQNGFYCSTVYAYYSKHTESSVVVFDKSNSHLVAVDCVDTVFGVMRLNVFIADDNDEDWVENGKWSGFDFIVNDEALLKKIKKGDDIHFTVLDKCRSLQTSETFCGWNNLDTDSDIKKLMNITSYFHDGSIKSIERNDNDICVEFNCWDCRVKINFINIIDYDEAAKTNWNNNCIMEAITCFENGNIKWYVDGFCFWEYDNQECYFVAQKAQYKLEFD